MSWSWKNCWQRIFTQASEVMGRQTTNDRFRRHERKNFYRPLLDVLEDRTLLAAGSLSITGSLLAFTAGAATANNVTLSYDGNGNTYTIKDTADVIVAPGCAGDGTHQVTCSAAGITLVQVQLGDLDDTFNLQSSKAAVAVDGGEGGDTYNINASAVGAAGLSINDSGSSGLNTFTIDAGLQPITFANGGPGVLNAQGDGAGLVTFFSASAYNFAVNNIPVGGLSLQVNGAATPDGTVHTTTLSLNGNALQVQSNSVSYSFPTNLIGSLSVSSTGDDNTLLVDNTHDLLAQLPSISYGGGGGKAQLDVTGDAQASGTFAPSSTTAGAGTVTVGASTIGYTGVQAVQVSRLAKLTLVAPGDASNLTVTNPGPGVSQVVGAGASLASETLTFFDVASFVLDAKTHNSGGGDHITFGPALQGLDGVGASGAVEVKPNDTPATASPLLPGQFGSGSLNPAGDTNYWVMAGAKAGDLVFAYVQFDLSTTGTLEVFANDGTTSLGFGNTGGRSDAAVAGVPVPQDGNIYFKIKSASGEKINHYDLHAAIVNYNDAAFSSGNNTSLATADPVTAGVMIGFLTPHVDGDNYFSFHANAGQRISIVVDGDPNGNLADVTALSLQLLDSAGADFSGSSTHSSPTNPKPAAGLEGVAPTTGLYYLRVRDFHFFDTFDSPNAGNYQFTVQIHDFDKGTPLTNVRVVTGSGQDTLTVNQPYLPPGGGQFRFEAGGSSSGSDQLIVNTPVDSVNHIVQVRMPQRIFAIPISPTDRILEMDPVKFLVTNTLVAPESTAFTRDGLAFDGQSLFFFNEAGSHKLWQLDPDTGAVLHSTHITAGSGNYGGIALLNGLVYLVDVGANKLLVFNPASNTITGTVDFGSLNPGVQLSAGGLAGIHGPDGLLATTADGQIAEINPATGKVVHSFIATRNTNNLHGVAVVNGTIYENSHSLNNNAIPQFNRQGVVRDVLVGFASDVGSHIPFPLASIGADDPDSRVGLIDVFGQAPIAFDPKQFGAHAVIQINTGNGNDLTEVFSPGVSGLPQVNLNGQGGADSVTVVGQTGKTEAFVATPAGPASGQITATATNLQVNFVHVTGRVAVDGGTVGSSDALTVLGRVGVDDHTTIGPDPVYQGQVAIDPALIPIRFQNLGSLAVKTGGGSHGDQITASPLGIPVSVDSQAATGETLTLDTTGVSAPRAIFAGISQQDNALIDPQQGASFGSPPHPVVAAGPTVNVGVVAGGTIAITDKASGAIRARASLTGLEGFFTPLGTTLGADPQAFFDAASGRFFVFVTDNDQATGAVTFSKIDVAVSTTSTPTNLTTDWHKFSLNVLENTATPATLFLDFLRVGVDEKAIYLTGNMFTSSGSFFHVRVIALDKAALLAGTVNILVDRVGPDFAINNMAPAQSYGGAPSNTAYFVGNTNALTGRITVYTMDLVSGNIWIDNLTGAGHPTPIADVPQADGGLGFTNLDAVAGNGRDKVFNAVYRNGSLWVPETVGTADGRIIVRWYEIATNGRTAAGGGSKPTIRQDGVVDPGPGLNAFWPAINVNKAGEMGLSFALSGPDIFAGIAYTGRRPVDPLGYTAPIRGLQAGQGPHDLTPFIQPDSNRWGDFSGLAVDPVDDSFWIFNLVARREAVLAPNRGSWDTVLGNFQVSTHSQVVTLTGTGAGTIQVDGFAPITFAHVQNLNGGAGVNRFVFQSGGSVRVTITGNGRGDFLDYSALRTPVVVNLATGQASYTGGVRNIQNVIGSATGGDRLTGNAQGNILVAHGGNNILTAGSGRSLLIGGYGLNLLIGGAADDLLINGSTVYDANIATLQFTLGLWQSNLSYASRLAALQAGPNKLAVGKTVFVYPGRSGGIGPRAGHGGSVYESTLLGNGGQNWFITNSFRSVVDRKPGEVETIS